MTDGRDPHTAGGDQGERSPTVLRRGYLHGSLVSASLPEPVPQENADGDDGDDGGDGEDQETNGRYGHRG